MKSLIKILLGISGIAAVLSPFIVNFYFTYQQEHLSCWSKIHIKNGETEYTAIQTWKFNAGTGEVNSVGEYIEKDKKPRKIALGVVFTYSHEKERTLLISQNSAKNPEVAKLLEPMMPDFFLYKHMGLSFKIYRLKNNNFVFNSDGIPYLVCHKETD